MAPSECALVLVEQRLDGLRELLMELIDLFFRRVAALGRVNGLPNHHRYRVLVGNRQEPSVVSRVRVKESALACSYLP